ncbi:MAG: AAA family ATPase [Candidatus Wallbacteria bacterium]|nr:AAA family ATPase [Candidatus Wallbacteria bacterium]
MIPTGSGGFYGRDSEFRELLSAFPDQKVIIIAGLGGIGKSALARAFAASMSETENYRDKVLFITCRNGWTELDLFSELLEQAGERSGRSGTPLSPDRIARLLEAKSIALFLDDFHLLENDRTRELIRECRLILSKGRLVIISRKRPELSSLELIDIFQLKLDGLKEQDAFLLMDQLLSFHHLPHFSSEQKKGIFKRTGGHPFFIKLLISLLVSGAHSLESLLTGEDYQKELENSLLSRVWENLDSFSRALGLRLALLRIPVRPEDLPGSGQGLRRLLDYFLLEHNQFGRIFLHDLLKEHFTSKIECTQKKEMHLEIASLLEHKKNAEILELKETFYQYQEAGETERAIDVLLRLCDEQQLLGAGTENVQNQVEILLLNGSEYRTGELRQALVSLLIYRRKFEEAKQALNSVDRDKRRSLEARLFCEMGRLNEAKSLAENLLPELQQGRERTETLLVLAECSHTLGDYIQAENCYHRLKATETGASPLLQARVDNDYGVFLYYRGEIREALELARSAEVVYRQYNAYYAIAEALYSQAYYHFDLQEVPASLETLESVIAIRKELKDNHGLAYCFNLKGEILFWKGEIQEAIRVEQEGLEYSRRDALVFIRGVIHNTLGTIYTRIGDQEQAETNFKTSLALLGQIDDPWRVAWARQNYAQYLLVCRRTDEAREYLDQVADFAEITRQPRMSATLYFFRSLIQGIQGDENGRKHDFGLFLNCISALPEPTREKLQLDFKWYADAAAGKKEPGLLLLTRDEKKDAEIREISSSRQQKTSFEIFIDFDERELLVNGRAVKFFQKRIMVPLLQVFASDPGKIVKPQGIFQRIWERKFDPESDGSTFRMTITRLRSALDKKNPDRFICYSPEAGGYYFNNRCNYCIIMPKTDGISSSYFS